MSDSSSTLFIGDKRFEVPRQVPQAVYEWVLEAEKDFQKYDRHLLVLESALKMVSLLCDRDYEIRTIADTALQWSEAQGAQKK